MYYSFIRMFLHADPVHLLLNLYGFYHISKALHLIDREHLIFPVVLINLILDYLVYGYGYSRCSIGFSGVIFGLITYLLLKISYSDLIFNVGLLLYPSIIFPRISLSGHLIGVVSGLLIYATS